MFLAWLLVLAWPVLAERLPIKTYTTADGLAHDRIHRIVRDSHGFLWFCTSEGLSRFDGYQFTNYTPDQGLPHRAVNDLLETRHGVYWVATANGVCRFNPTGRTPARTSSPAENKNGPKALRSTIASEAKFVVYRPSTDQLGAQIVFVLLEDRTGVIWCATMGGLYRLEPEKDSYRFRFVDIGILRETSDDTIVTALMEDRQRALWVATRNGLYRRSPDGRAQRFTTQHGLPHNYVYTLLEDGEGQLWAGTHLGLCRLVAEPDVDRPVVTRVYTTKDGLPGLPITWLIRSSAGRLWIGAHGGFSAFDGQRFRSYTTAHGLSDRKIVALAEDREGTLWLGTEASGAMRIARNGFLTYDEADGLGDNQIRSIFENQAGDLCVHGCCKVGVSIRTVTVRERRPRAAPLQSPF